jgi:hypothetical protein
MTFPRSYSRLLAVGGACAAAGAGAIATAGAAPTTPAAKHSAAGRAAHRALARRAVQGDVVIATKSGFATVTFNRGFVQSVSGRQLTIREGTKKATYKTVTLTIPTSAKVRDNGRTAALSQVTPGQRVAVVQAPKRTRVIARNASS